jgi:hypothetical protein
LCGCRCNESEAGGLAPNPEDNQHDRDYDLDKFRDQLFSYEFEKFTIDGIGLLMDSGGQELSQGTNVSPVIEAVAERRRVDKNLNDLRNDAEMRKIAEYNME